MESHLVSVGIDWKTMLQLSFILLSLEQEDWLDHFNPLTSRSKVLFLLKNIIIEQFFNMDWFELFQIYIGSIYFHISNETIY